MTYKDRTKTLSISYVVPTLNSAATLDMTLYALRSQKDVEVNIIVVDSGSTDETLDICKRWDVKTLYAYANFTS
jgi:glycosyltransferase involved in cell wall biosynthesis